VKLFSKNIPASVIMVPECYRQMDRQQTAWHNRSLHSITR